MIHIFCLTLAVMAAIYLAPVIFRLTACLIVAPFVLLGKILNAPFILLGHLREQAFLASEQKLARQFASRKTWHENAIDKARRAKLARNWAPE